MTHTCVTCEWFYISSAFGKACKRPITMARDPVTGDVTRPLAKNCYSERARDRLLLGRLRCGPSGRFWEKKS